MSPSVCRPWSCYDHWEQATNLYSKRNGHSFSQTHYASEDDPSFLLEDQDLEEDEDDDEVTG